MRSLAGLTILVGVYLLVTSLGDVPRDGGEVGCSLFTVFMGLVGWGVRR